MDSKQPPPSPPEFQEVKQLSADDERYFTSSGAKYEKQLDTFTKQLKSKLKGYAPEVKQIFALEGAHKMGINEVREKSLDIRVGFMQSSRTAKFIGIALGVWAMWELYVGAKWILKKWADHEAREQGLIPPPPPKRQRIHSRDWHHNTDNDL